MLFVIYKAASSVPYIKRVLQKGDESRNNLLSKTEF